MIKLELLKMILDDHLITNCEYSTDYPNIIMYGHSYELKIKKVHVGDLAFDCKKFIHEKYGVVVRSYTHDFCVSKLSYGETGDMVTSSIFCDDRSEPYTIFLASLWVVNNLSPS